MALDGSDRTKMESQSTAEISAMCRLCGAKPLVWDHSGCKGDLPVLAVLTETGLAVCFNMD